jgi:tetratricopeptide (TPR) repeat protein
METEINEQLRNMSLFSFKRMVDNLCDRRLITKGQDDTYTTHPLIKNYFESIFEEEDKKFCHKKIYQYIGTYAPEKPETLEEMQPLFEQVYHGCKARLYDEVLDSIYYGKIRLQNFLTWKLGCWDTNLTLIQNFFKQGDIYTEPLVSKSKDKGRLINQAALSIMNLGKIEEAKSLYEKTISLFTSQDEWKYASIVYQHLSELQRLTGYLLDAKTSSEKAVKLSIKAKDVREKHNSTACLAYVLFLLGKRDNAAIEFRKAFELQEEFNPIERYLYSIDGIWHTDFLITQNRIEEAFKVSSENMKICKKNGWIADISRCCRSLASLERIKRNFDKSEEHINDALEIACKIGMPELEVEALVEFGKLKLETKDYKGAEADSNQALKLIDRTGFKLYEPDAEVVLAKVYLALGDMDKAKEFANSAYKKASEMHYHWPKVEAEELLKEISH